ncbi:MAG: hypothetical protein GX834_06865 [Clostridiaceae bacterium]|nr:hypothetical protein [Clostridiaceae bacterium]
MKQANFTSKSTMTEENDGYRFTFFCDLCDEGYSTRLISAENAKEAYELAKNEARQHFNRCYSCHRWVCDEHYNEDYLLCIKCAPHRHKPEG